MWTLISNFPLRPVILKKKKKKGSISGLNANSCLILWAVIIKMQCWSYHESSRHFQCIWAILCSDKESNDTVSQYMLFILCILCFSCYMFLTAGFLLETKLSPELYEMAKWLDSHQLLHFSNCSFVKDISLPLHIWVWS